MGTVQKCTSEPAYLWAVPFKTPWAGVDVGARRKGFHCAFLYRDRHVELACLPTAAEVADLIVRYAPALTAIDSPKSLALDGEHSRRCERDFIRARICNIRFTPDRAGLNSNPTYYEWIEQGLALYDECRKRALDVVECFPTASWTIWAGRRGSQRRARWTTQALVHQNLKKLPRRMNQDVRDGIGAALTARAHWTGNSRCFGDIVVPASPIS